jgi:hypothetical protein
LKIFVTALVTFNRLDRAQDPLLSSRGKMPKKARTFAYFDLVGAKILPSRSLTSSSSP